MSHRQKPNEGSVEPAVIPDWVATGDAGQDLPAWASDLPEGESALASCAAECDGVTGEDLTKTVEAAFRETISSLPGGPCKIWSFLPRPTDRDGDALERYMRFNAGRTSAHRALADRIRIVPAGTCVGHSGTRLVVHALWIDARFTAVENPRQRPAWLYSNRYGPVPPAFTRGVRTPTMLIASGTASVVGEDSMHRDSLSLQFSESLVNLDALAKAGQCEGQWRSMQIYVRDREHLAPVSELAAQRFGDRIDRVLHVPICRRELLVEIEGVCDVL